MKRFTPAVAAFCISILYAFPAGAVDFLRGDANGDGTMSISDSHYLNSFLFLGGMNPECYASGDINFDGIIDLSDSVYLLGYLFLGQKEPCDPFPEVGPDPAPGRLECSAHGGGSPVADAAARIEVLSAAASADGKAKLAIRVSSSRSLAGYSGTLAVAGNILAAGQVGKGADLSGAFRNGFNGSRVLGGKLRFGFLTTFTEEFYIPPGNDARVLEIEVCLARGTPAGEYPLTLEAGELVDGLTGRAIRPALAAGILTVPPQSAGAGCDARAEPDQSNPGCNPPEPPPPPPPPPGEEVPFLRGDANDDGEFTAADAHFLLNFLFRGGPIPDCPSAGDLNDDGFIDISDAVSGLNHLVLGGSAPCSPFPGIGLDPIPGGGLHCSRYGNGSPLADASAALQVLDVDAGSDGRAAITIVVSGSRPIAGYSGVLTVDGEVFAGGWIADATDLTGLLRTGFEGARVVGGKLRFGFLASILESRSIPPGTGVAVLELSVCLAAGAAPGDYRMEIESGELIDQETGRSIPCTLGSGLLRVPQLAAGAGCAPIPELPGRRSCSDPVDPPPPPPPPPPGGAADFIRGDANADGKVSISDSLMLRRYLFQGDAPPTCLDAGDANDDGVLDLSDPVFILSHIFLGGSRMPRPYLEVGPDPTPDGLSCSGYSIIRPIPVEDTVTVAEVAGDPGEPVEIPVQLTNSVMVEAYQLVIRYDPQTFQPGSKLSFGGTYYEDRLNTHFAGLDSRAAPGVMAVGLIPSFIETGFETPPGADRLVFKIPGTIPAGAPPGTVVVLESPGDEGVGPLGLRNELTYRGQARYISVQPRLRIQKIAPDITIFVRGDANGDRGVDISDAVYILGYLFLGDASPRCPDAADANDDGEIDISDAVAILETLFLGGSMVAPPYPGGGADLSPDFLGPCRP